MASFASFRKWLNLLQVVMLVFCQVQHTMASHQEKQLYASLVNGYNKQIRPVKRPNEAMHIKMSLSLIQVLGLDEGNSAVTVRAWIRMHWKDEYLIWNPQQHGGIVRMNFVTGLNPKSNIWTPDVTLYNALRVANDKDMDAIVHHDGTVSWVQPYVYTVTCNHEFKGNSWMAIFNMSSWTYDANLLDLQPFNSHAGIKVDLENFDSSDHFNVLNNTGNRQLIMKPCCADNPFVSLSFELKLRKKIGLSLLGRKS